MTDKDDRAIFDANTPHMALLQTRLNKELNLFQDFCQAKSKMDFGTVRANMMIVLGTIVGGIIAELKDPHHQKMAQNHFNDSLTAFVKASSDVRKAMK